MNNRTKNYICAGILTIVTIGFAQLVFSYKSNFIEGLILYYVILIYADIEIRKGKKDE
jgi:hypothetical protein